MKKIVLFASLIMIMACSTQQSFELSIDRSGTGHVAIQLSEPLVLYINDLSELFGEELDILDPEAISESLAENSISVTEIKRPDFGTLELKLKYPDFAELAQTEETSFINIEFLGNATKMTLIINAESVNTLLSMSPLKDSMLGQTLLPPEGESMSEDEYIDYVVWALEEYEAEESLESILRASKVSISIKIPSVILTSEGFVRNGQKLTVDIPLVKLLSGNIDQTYIVEFK